MIYVQVALGGALGSVLRFWLAGLVAQRAGAPFWGTLAVNVIGSFVIGVLASTRADGPTDMTRYFLMVGVLGGFTTFSTFSLQTVELLQKGSTGLALANVALSVVLCVGGAWLGVLAGTAWGGGAR